MKSLLFAASLVWGLFTYGAATTYTWTGGGENDNWSNPTNWGKTAAGDYPGKFTTDLAVIGKDATVTLDVSKKITKLTVNTAGIAVTLKDGGGTLTLTDGSGFLIGAANSSGTDGSSIVLDGAKIVAASSTSYLKSGASMELRNGAELTLKSFFMRSKNAFKNGSLTVASRSKLTLAITGDTAFGISGDAVVTIDDATVAIAGNVYLNNNSSGSLAGGGRLVFKGANPLLTSSGGVFRSENNDSRTNGADFDFIIPAAGWSQAPLSLTNPDCAFLNSTAPGQMRFNVLDESPILTGQTAKDVPLVAWAGTIDTSHLETSCPYPTFVHVEVGEKAMVAKLEDARGKYAVSHYPADIGASTPAAGVYAAGTESIAFSAPDVTYRDGVARVTGYRIYDVDPISGERTEIAGSPFTGNAFSYTHPGTSYRVIEWQWSWTPSSPTVYVSTSGDDANGGTSWADAKKTLHAARAVAKDNDTILLGDGVFRETLSTTLDLPIRVTSLNGRDKTRLFANNLSSRLIAIKHADAKVQGLTLFSDYSRTTYGAVSLSAGLFEDCIVTNFSTPRAVTSGAAVNMSGGTVRRCHFSHNELYTSGGSASGAVVKMTGGLVENCEIVHNTAPSGGADSCGGAVNMSGGTLRNCLVACNVEPTRTAGVYAKGGLVENCTIVSNKTSATAFGGVYAEKARFVNCVIANNVNYDGIKDVVLGTGNVFEHCCCESEDLGGVGCTTVAPVFVDPDGGDYRIASGVCIDGGTNQAWMSEATDLDGRGRILSGIVDIGCYEFVEKGLVAAIVSSATYGTDSLTVEFMANVKGADKTGLKYSWALTNPKVFDYADSDRAVVTNTYAPGVYSVRLKVTNASGETSDVTAAGLVTVAPNTMYVCADNATPSAPYGSWATAATRIEDALAIAGDGVTVLVSNATYQVVKPVLSAGVRVKGVGPVRPIITNNGGTVPIFSLGHKDACLDSLDICGGGKGGVYILNGGTVTNCVIRDCYYEVGEGGAGVQMYNVGTVVDSRIVNNTLHVSAGTTRQGAGIYADGAKCLIDRVQVVSNFLGSGTANKPGYGVNLGDGATIRNSLVAFNRAGSDKGEGARGAVGFSNFGTVENCTVVSNRTSNALVAGVELKGSSSIRLCNNIVFGNTCADGEFNLFTNGVTSSASTKPMLYTNCTDRAGFDLIAACVDAKRLTAVGNFAADPLFRAPVKGNFRLQPGSPCMNAAARLAWMAEGSLDLDGQPRIHGSAPDLGCYENSLRGFAIIVR